MKRIVMLTVVVLISIMVAFFVAKTYIPKANVGWDEASQIHVAYRIYDSARAKSVLTFLKVTASQVYYPPLQSLFYGISSLPFGFSIEKARAVGLFWFILGGFLMFLLGKELTDKRKTLMGILGLFFFLSSPMMLLFSSLVLKEIMGVALSLLVVLLYLRARKGETLFPYILVSLLLFTLSMTKYNYSFLIAMVVFLEAGVSFLFSKSRRKIILSHLVIFAPFLLLLGFWLFFPYNKLSSYISIVTSPVGFQTKGMTDFWGILLFYPRAIALMYSPSVILGFFLLLSLVISLRYFNDFRIRVLWLLLAINFTLVIIYNGNMQERYIFTSMPFLFLIGAFILTKLLVKSLTFSKKPLISGLILGIWLLAGGKILVDMAHLPNFVYAVGARTLRYPVFNQTDYQDKDIWFNYNPSSWPKNLPFGAFEKPNDVLDFVASSVDLTKPVEVMGYTNEFSPPYFDLIFALHKQKREFVSLPYASFVVTLEVSPTSRFYTRDYQLMNAWQLEKIREIEKDPSLVMINKKKFESLDVEVTIYGRK